MQSQLDRIDETKGRPGAGKNATIVSPGDQLEVYTEMHSEDIPGWRGPVAAMSGVVDGNVAIQHGDRIVPVPPAS